MTADRKRPPEPLLSAGILARYAQAYAREVGVAEGRVRALVAYMIMAGALERSTGAADPQFIVKGGVALELLVRLRSCEQRHRRRPARCGSRPRRRARPSRAASQITCADRVRREQPARTRASGSRRRLVRPSPLHRRTDNTAVMSTPSLDSALPPSLHGRNGNPCPADRSTPVQCSASCALRLAAVHPRCL